MSEAMDWRGALRKSKSAKGAMRVISGIAPKINRTFRLLSRAMGAPAARYRNNNGKTPPSEQKQAWDEEGYLRIYPDVRQAVALGKIPTGLSHWLTVGQTEGRLNPATDDVPSFSNWDEQGYLHLYPDVEIAVTRGDFASGYAHYVIQGKQESRRLPHPFGPAWLIEELREISSVEQALYPSRKLFAKFSQHKPQIRKPLGQNIHVALQKALQHKSSHVMLLPWLRRGGADLGALHHLNALASHPLNKILVITTEDVESTWLSRLPASAEHLDLGPLTRDIDSFEDCMYLLTRLLLAVQVDVIHIINSNLAWKTIAMYGSAICEKSKVFASIYCVDYDSDGTPVGYTSDLEKSWHRFEKIFTDHAKVVDDLVRTCAYPEDIFCILPFPAIDQKPFKGTVQRLSNRKRVLWAGRLDRQKRPDLLREIALRMPETDFIVYGVAMLDSIFGLQTLRALQELENVQFRGPFDGFNEIPREEFSLLLYTSGWDGMPNIVLESFSAGLPVVSSNVGGISEAYPRNSPFLVKDIENIDAYVSIINECISSPIVLATESDRVLNYSREERTFDRFARRLDDVKGYLYVESAPSGHQDVHKPTKSF